MRDALLLLGLGVMEVAVFLGLGFHAPGHADGDGNPLLLVETCQHGGSSPAWVLASR